MKSIKVKSYNKLIEDIKLDGDTGNWNGKLKKRIVDAIRLAKECRAAAKVARESGDEESAAWLEQRAEDYEQAAKNWNQDTLDDDAENQASSQNSNDEDKGDEAESAEDAAARAQNAANRAKASANAAEKAANKTKEKAEEAAENGTPEEAQEAAEAAKNAAESAQKAKEAAEKAQEAADKAKDAASNSDAEGASDAADKAEEAEEQAKDAAKQAMGKSDGSEDANGKDKVDADDNSQVGDAEGGPDSDSDSSDGDSEAASDGDSSSDANSDSEDEDSSDSDGGDKDESGSDNNSDSDSDSDGESSSKGSKGKKSKSSSSDSDSDGDSDDSESDDEDEDGDDSSDEPIKDPFADDEDIPSLSMGSPNGKEPRDPTVDEIIKQLQGLEGEAKRGAIAGLSDLINNKKNESLTEAFKKSIREFSDEEWDEMSEETIDKIEKVKHIDTINNVDGIKAGFKGWSDNAVARQELEDEENQNIQRDILAKRAKENELAKYNSLETLSDFEIDFENCIRDQVELVMQEYQSYDEINPEYEDEDIIMKADVQKMLPSEVIPSVAVFFDQSSSWTDNDIRKGEQAIATVKKKYVDTGLCKLDLFYFSDIVVTNRNSSALRNGTTAWPDIIRTIASNDPKNVIIMTDSDMNTWNNHGESYTVEGCVWWIWKNGLRAPNLPKQLRGMQHNYECEFH